MAIIYNFADIPSGHYGAILADPPWDFQAWGSLPYYDTMKETDIAALPIGDLAAEDCVLFLWVCWPLLEQALRVINAWGFKYKTCGFAWMKANATQVELFREEIDPLMGLGYWTRANSEICLLAVRGHPKRQSADVLQGIIEPRREHSRKPDCVRERIQRLVAGPYLELFARQRRSGWDCWGNEINKFKEAADVPPA